MTTPKNSSQFMVKFFTRSPRYSVADIPYSIPSNSNIDGLNLLINGILKEDQSVEYDEKPEELVEFDFYINSKPIITTLEEFVSLNDEVKVESLIEIEYTEKCPPPKPVDTIMTDDWISSIRANEDHILLGSYNNSVQVWNTNGDCIVTLPGHNGAVKAVSWIANDDKGEAKFLSASHDQTILIWNWNKLTNKVDKAEKCIGHTESVECIDVNTKNSKFVSGSWDKTLKLWSLVDDLPDESINKKKKSDVSVSIKTPIFTLSGHSENISCCKWMNENNVCTASWDHSIKLWDVFIGQETQTLKSVNKIFLSIDFSQINQLIAAGLNDSHIRLYDPRSNEGNLVKTTLSSHTGWCSSVFWSRTNDNLLISGSYDLKAKLWDIRNPKTSMFDMIGHEDKVLCVDWSVKDLMLTGSADNSFKMYKT